ncbi:hypothetical protein AKJ36_00275 [candidate division MSBL1 archaeon SCGC-AAA259I07]|uniref:Uncharacterized protein n=2 Tax=candidate division MSBL1 TaxID=215777 RepID=A0A133U8Z1_9EURY|nr:hypothetical protein AKJ61_00060 [candidate division MSBL1 archaeon SCGC-AAA259B11]KXA95515.1 hypothetical protein AKJ36_00275 [candidate division MSBL1 archaeon SCGC-AAA259I07]
MEINPKNVYDLREQLLNLPYCLDVKIPKNLEEKITAPLQKPRIGLLKGAEKEYRDFNKRDSLHVRVYETYLKAHIDRKNPIYKPISHFIQDALLQNAKILAPIVISLIAFLITTL